MRHSIFLGLMFLGSATAASEEQQAGLADALPGFVSGDRVLEECPDDAITGQEPGECGTTQWYFYSDFEFGSGTLWHRTRGENFPRSGLLDPNDPNQWIGTITWYGVYVDAQASGCTKPHHNFRIRFYEDNNGTLDPNNWLYEEHLTAVGTQQPRYVILCYDCLPAVCWRFDAVLTVPRQMAKGWFSIQGEGTPGCFFLWEGSPEGDNRFAVWWESNIPGTLNYTTTFCDLNYCFGVRRFGACCDDRTATCWEDYPEDTCLAIGGRFHADQPCSSFGGDPNDPNNAECGFALGACCHDDGTCAVVPAMVCLGGGPPPLCPGDADCDGERDFDDIDPFVAVLAGGPPCIFENLDVNGDGVINFDDIDPFVNNLGQPCGTPITSLWLGLFSTCSQCCKLDCNDPNLGVTHHEIELCGQDLNGGCYSATDPNDPNTVNPAAWEDLGILDPNHPTVVCGTLWAENGTRDTDWYKFRLPILGTLAWETQSDIPLLSTPIWGDANFGPPTIPVNCGPFGSPWGYWNSPRAYLCHLGGAAPTDVFLAGPTYWWIAFPDSGSAIFYGFPCADNWVNYRMTITNVSITCDPCLQTDPQEGETECVPPDTFNSGCDSTDGLFHVQAALTPATYYCGKSGTWADPNGNTLVDYDWWKIVLSGTVKKRLQIQMRAAFNVQWELYSVPGDVCANKVRLDYYEFGACESNVTLYTTCLEANNAVYYMRVVPMGTVDCTQWNHYRLQYAVLNEAPACTACSVVCSTTVDNACQTDPNVVDTNEGCNAADPNAAANYMALVPGNNVFGAKYCGRVSTFTSSSGANVDLDWFRYTQLAARTKLVIRAKAMFRMSINIANGCIDPNNVTHGWDRPCKGTTTAASQTWRGLTPGTTYTGVVIYSNGGGDGTGEQPLKQFFLGLPCSDNRNDYELELQCQT